MFNKNNSAKICLTFLILFFLIHCLAFAEPSVIRLIKNNNISKIRKLFKININYFKNCDSFERNALHYAAIYGKLKLINFFALRNININKKDTLKGFTPLHYACLNNNTACARLLLAHGAKPDISDNNGNSSLFYAAGNGNYDLVKILIIHNAKTTIINNYGQSALSACLMLGKNKLMFPYSANKLKNYLKTVNYLITPDSLITKSDCFGKTPLDYIYKSNLSQQKLNKLLQTIIENANK